mmetsp:Transcript_11476/g.30142  ORF Transcript_11476/g.30142 Transcript_11476/m.30142 type:complete len:350 (-) Transcript_11476:383-1432(-)
MNEDAQPVLSLAVRTSLQHMPDERGLAMDGGVGVLQSQWRKHGKDVRHVRVHLEFHAPAVGLQAPRILHGVAGQELALAGLDQNRRQRVQLPVLRRYQGMPRILALRVVAARGHGRGGGQEIREALCFGVLLLCAREIRQRAHDHGAKWELLPGVAQRQQEAEAEAAARAVAREYDLGGLVPTALLEPVIACDRILDWSRPWKLRGPPRIHHACLDASREPQSQLLDDARHILQVRLARKGPVPATMQVQDHKFLGRMARWCCRGRCAGQGYPGHWPRATLGVPFQLDAGMAESCESLAMVIQIGQEADGRTNNAVEVGEENLARRGRLHKELHEEGPALTTRRTPKPP